MALTNHGNPPTEPEAKPKPELGRTGKPSKKGHLVQKLPKSKLPKPSPIRHPNESIRLRIIDGLQYGLTQEQVCRMLQISHKTLYGHYRAEADTSHGEMLLKVSKNLHQIALDTKDPRSLTASIFILKTKGGFKDVVRTEITGKDGAPIQLAATKNVIDPREMSPEVREEFRLLLEQKVAEIEQQERDDGAEDAEYAEVSDAEDDGEEE